MELSATDADLPFDDVLNPKKESGGAGIPAFDETDIFGEEGFEEEQFESDGEMWKKYTQKQRMFILLVSAMAGILQPFSTTMVIPSFKDIQDDLDTIYLLVVMTVTGYNVMAGIFPLVYGPVSDRFGRKFIWYFTLPAFAVAATLSGFSFDIWMLIVCRSVLGAFSCSVVIIGTGIVTDIFSPETQGKGLGLQQLPALISPLLGYPLGGMLTSMFGWRSVNFFLAIGSVPIILLIFLALPETLPKSHRKQFSAKSLLVAMNPWNTLKLILRPVIGCIALTRAMGYSAMMLFAVLNTAILETVHHDSSLVVGLWNIPFSLGTIVGSIAGGIAVDRGLKRLGRGGRLLSANVSTFILCVGLIGYGWTIEWNQWIGLFNSILIGIGVSANRPGYLSYAMEENPSNSAAVTGATMLFSMCMTLPVTLLGPPLAQFLGVPAVFTIMSSITLATAIPTMIIMALNMSKQEVVDEGY